MTDVFHGVVFAVSVVALLFSTVTVMRTDINSTELFLIRERMENFEIQLSTTKGNLCEPCSGKYFKVR